MSGFPQIPGYKIVSILGEGGMAAVYLAIQEKLGRNVAVKILEPSLLRNEIAAARFDREARTAAGLSHSNIIQIFDYGKSGDYHYIIMEYLQDSLKDLLMRDPEGRIDPMDSLDLVKEIMGALDYAHFRGIYHRDIKPDNIMFREDRTPVLVDFGIAGLYDTTSGLTKTGKSMGTIYYMSPEQCNAQPVDGKSDIYSLGVVLFELLTGNKPYDGETPFAIAFQHLKDDVPRLPQELNQYQPLIDKMMAKDKEKRISSSPEFLAILDKILIAHNTPPSSGPFPQTMVSQTMPGQPFEKPMKSQHQRKTTKKDFTFKEPSNDITSVLGNQLNSMKDQLDSLNKDLKTKFNTFIKTRINTFKNYPPKKKLLIEAIPIIMVGLLFIYMTFIRQPEIKRTYITELIDYASQYYQKNLSLAHDLSTKQDLESLIKARDLTTALIKITPSQELKEQEKKLTDKVTQLEKEFDMLYNEAMNYFKQKNFAKAQESISKAKKIKATQGLELFEKSIEMYAKNPGAVETPKP